MKISIVPSSLALLASVSALSPSLETPASPRVVSGFLSGEEIEKIANAELYDASNGRAFGQAFLDLDMALRLPRDHSTPVMTTEDGSKIPIMTSILTGSSPRHVDCHMGEDREGIMVQEDEVGFIFLNSNPNAAFVHGDTVIPVVAGNLVTFVGGVEHNTVVNDGHVHLAGPFHLDTIGFINMQPESEKVIFPSDDDDSGRTLTEARDRAEGKLRGLQKKSRVLATRKKADKTEP